MIWDMVCATTERVYNGNNAGVVKLFVNVSCKNTFWHVKS